MTKFRIEGFAPGCEVRVVDAHNVVVDSAARAVASRKAGADGSVVFDLEPGVYTALHGSLRVQFTIPAPAPEPEAPEPPVVVVHETPRDDHPPDRVVGSRSSLDRPKPKRKAKPKAAKKGK